ncbi:MAG: hypothetical protein IJ400_02645 [Clostridia bacterium]|nr:hypothetical protein [Clostridia bacterium]
MGIEYVIDSETAKKKAEDMLDCVMDSEKVAEAFKRRTDIFAGNVSGDVSEASIEVATEILKQIKDMRRDVEKILEIVRDSMDELANEIKRAKNDIQ